MPEGRQPRGVTPRPRSGAAAESTRLRRCRNRREVLPRIRGRGWGGGREEIPSIQGQGQRREELPRVRGQGRRRGGYTPRPKPKARGGEWEELPRAPKPEARGGGREELLHAPMPKAKGGSREEQPHARGQVQWPGGPTPRPRSLGCVGAGGRRRAIPR